MDTILKPGITQCSLKRCGDIIKPEYGYVQAVDPNTKKVVYFCSECYDEQALIWRNDPASNNKVSST